MSVASSEIVNALSLFNIETTPKLFTIGISNGPGATTILNSSLNFFFNFPIKGLIFIN